VEDQKDYQNCHPSDSHKTINLGEGSPEEEDSLEEEDSPEVEDIQEEEEYHLRDHQEAVGDHHRCLYHKYRVLKGNW